MRLFTTTAIALAAMTAAAPAAAQAPAAKGQAAAAAPQIKLSKKASKAIIELQTAVKANDVASIPAKASAAQAVAQTPEDRFAIGKLMLDAAQAAKNTDQSVQAIDYIAASNYLPKSQVAGLYNSIGVQFFNAKNAPRAVTMFQKALAIDPNNADTLRLLAESQNSSATPEQAIAAFKRAIAQASASGQKLPEDTYKRAVSAAYNAKSPEAIVMGRQWAAAYPSPDSWRNSIAIYRNMNHPGVQGTIDLLRLMRATGAMSSGDYSLYASAAADQGNFAEAQSVIDEGLANKKVDPSNSLFRDIMNGLKTKPKAGAADLANAAKGASSGSALVGIGDRYYGLGDYAKAVETYRAAQAKGADANLVNLHIGMALARSGDKAGAATALNQVGGVQADIAKYWLIYVQ